MMKSCNCSSCGGSVKLYSRDYGNCDYCGNVNRVLSNGRTEIVKRETQIPESPTPTGDKVNNINIWLLIFGILLCGVALFYVSTRFKD